MPESKQWQTLLPLIRDKTTVIIALAGDFPRQGDAVFGMRSQSHRRMTQDELSRFFESRAKIDGSLNQNLY